MSRLAQAGKALAALGAGVAVLVAAGVITGSRAVIVVASISAASTALATYCAPRELPRIRRARR